MTNSEFDNNAKARRSVTDLVVAHDGFREMLEHMECLWRDAQAGIPAIAPFVGETGTGKTTAIRVFRARHAPGRSPDGLTMPVLCVNTPAKPTPNGLAERILHALGDPRPTAGSAAAKMDRIIKNLKAACVRVITLDDLQHFVDKRQQVAIYDAADYLKELLASHDVVILAFGLPECELVIQSNEQLKTRSKSVFKLKRFDWSDPPSQAQFVAVLEAFAGGVDDVELPTLASPEMSMRMYLATGGLIRYVSAVIGKAVRNAADQRSHSIRLEDLARAWAEEVIPPGPQYGNPLSRQYVLTDLATKISEAKLIGARVVRPKPARKRDAHRELAAIGL